MPTLDAERLNEDSFPEASTHPVGREWRERMGIDFVGDDSRRYYAEAQRRIHSCMAGRGFEYKPIEYVDVDVSLARAMNPLNASIASRFGYHLPPYDTPVDRNVRDDSFVAALEGSSEDQQSGCAWQAYSTIDSIGSEYFGLVNQTFSSMQSAVDGYYISDLGLSALQTWRTCMGTKGYQFASPSDAATSVMKSAIADTTEISVRLADLECDKEVGMTTSRSAWEGEHFELWMNESQALLVDVTSSHEEFEAAIEELESQVL